MIPYINWRDCRLPWSRCWGAHGEQVLEDWALWDQQGVTLGDLPFFSLKPVKGFSLTFTQIKYVYMPVSSPFYLSFAFTSNLWLKYLNCNALMALLKVKELLQMQRNLFLLQLTALSLGISFLKYPYSYKSPSWVSSNLKAYIYSTDSLFLSYTTLSPSPFLHVYLTYLSFIYHIILCNPFSLLVHFLSYLSYENLFS